MAESEGIEQHLVEVPRPDLMYFKERLVKADGTLLPLHKRTADGKRLSVAARYLINPWEYYVVYPKPGYYDIQRRMKEDADITRTDAAYSSWNEDSLREGVPELTGALLIDVYVDQEGALVPIGHMDWGL